MLVEDTARVSPISAMRSKTHVQLMGRSAAMIALQEEVDRVANIYNRLVLFDAHLAHGASAYFGDRLENARLFQNFFFNIV